MIDQGQIVRFLADPATYGSIAPVKRIDTHGAYVFLTDKDAYKIKRPVCYSYMDFSTLERREVACKAEVSINRPNAQDIYLAAVPITRDETGFHIRGSGEIVEWAVHMRRFDDEATLDRLAARQEIGEELVDQLAQTVSAAHRRASQRFGFPSTLHKTIVETAEELEVAQEEISPGNVTFLGKRMLEEFDKHHPLLIRRESNGKVRRCHGDLHLRNIVLHAQKPVLFDAIEFNDELASIDTLYDLAFLIMDLCQKGLRARACRLLNQYMWLSEDEMGEIEGLALLPLFLALRAAIRAKVLLAQAALDGKLDREQLNRYVSAAIDFLSPPAPRLVAIGGLSGTGKTQLAYGLTSNIGPAPGAVHLRSDIERKKLYGVPATSRLQQTAYDSATTTLVYRDLMALGRTSLEARHSVVLDATFRGEVEQQAAARLAAESRVPFTGLWLHAPLTVRSKRVEDRIGDASDATPQVAEMQAADDAPPLGWTTLDATGTPDATRKAALELLQPIS